MESDAVQDCRKRFAKLMGSESAWIKPPPAPVEEKTMAPNGDKARPGRVSARKQEEIIDSDDPESYMLVETNRAGPSKADRRRKLAATTTSPPTSFQGFKESEIKVFPKIGLHVGQVSRFGMEFAPWKLVEDYPFLFIGKANFEKSYPYFSADALFESMSWDFFYLHHPLETFRKAYLFVPTYQFEHLLQMVNCQLSIELRIPEGKNDEKFRLTFGDFGTPRPRYLGRAGSGKEFETLLDGMPDLDPDDLLEGVGAQAQMEFLDRLKEVHKAAKAKRKKDPVETLLKKIAVQKEWGRTTKRIQRYLGLRMKITNSGNDTQGSIELCEAVDVLRTLACEPEGHVVFVAIDVEAYEKNNRLVTEIGFATLDTRKIEGVLPGERAEKWFPLIEAEHFRIKENAWAVNREYVAGCPGSFNFGTSVFIETDYIAAAIRQVLQPAASPADLTPPSGNPGGTAAVRPVVLVFHDSTQDISHLDQMGYDVHTAPNVVEIVDTRFIHQHLRRRPNPAGLETVLNDLEIPKQDLHNAGNDAVYTLQAMLNIAVRRRLESLKDTQSVGEEVLQKTEDIHNYVFGAEDDGWKTGGEDSDGGFPSMSANPEPSVLPRRQAVREETARSPW